MYGEVAASASWFPCACLALAACAVMGTYMDPNCTIAGMTQKLVFCKLPILSRCCAPVQVSRSVEHIVDLCEYSQHYHSSPREQFLW